MARNLLLNENFGNRFIGSTLQAIRQDFISNFFLQLPKWLQYRDAARTFRVMDLINKQGTKGFFGYDMAWNIFSKLMKYLVAFNNNHQKTCSFSDAKNAIASFHNFQEKWNLCTFGEEGRDLDPHGSPL